MTKVVVVGSSNTDMIIQVEELPRPGETVLGGTFSTAAGGKGANQAVAAARAGSNVSLVACIGDDMFGEQALRGFGEAGIDTGRCIVDLQAPSGVAQIFVAADGENCIAVASGANACLSPEHIEAAADVFDGASVVLLQLETPLDTVLVAASQARAAGAMVVLNPAPAATLPEDIYPLVSLITPNETEAELLTGEKVDDVEGAARAAAVLHGRGVDTVMITLGRAGVYLSRDTGAGEPDATSFSAFTVEVLDTTAAGDVFNGCLAGALANGEELAAAVQWAQAAAALSVQTLGAQTSAPERSAINNFIQNNS